MANGRVVAPAPAFTPSQYGLLSVARDMTGEMPSHWEAGITYMPLCPYGDSTFDECVVVTGAGATPEPPVKAATFNNVRQAATPFTVYVRKDCSIPTFWNEAAGQVAEALTDAEAFEVEQSFWTGTAANATVAYPHLAANAALVQDRDTLQLAATVVPGGSLNVVLGFGLLEAAAMACTQGQATIHVPVSVASALIAWQVIKLQGGRYVSVLGNPVAIGNGYSGSSPTGAAATNASTWIYATGPVFYARSALREFAPRESIVRATNTMQQMAERTYVVGYSCCLLAKEIDLTKTISG